MQEVQIETSDVDVLLKQRVTVLSATPEKKWADRGAGVLTLRRSKAGGRPYLVFTTDTGERGVHERACGSARACSPRRLSLEEGEWHGGGGMSGGHASPPAGIAPLSTRAGSPFLTLAPSKLTPPLAHSLAGRVLINAPLLQGLKPQTNPKTPRNLIMMLANAAGGSVQQGMYVVKCEDAEAVKKLRGAILEHV